jgi:hypothetical protein
MSSEILERDQDYTTTLTETNLNKNESETDTDNDKNENLKNNKKKNNHNNDDINIDELINNNDRDFTIINMQKNKKDNKNDDNDDNNITEYGDIRQLSKNREKKQKNEIVTTSFKQNIIEEYIRPNLKSDISEVSNSRFTWARVATAMFCMSELLMIVQTALSFTAASYQLILISYLAGIIGVVAIGLNRFGAYSRNQSNEKNTLYNKLLKKIGINDSMPNLMEISDEKKIDKIN